MASAQRRSRKIRQRVSPTVKLGLRITTPEQVGHGIVEVDVQNHTEADQRATVRSKETKTIRKKTRMEKLVDARVLTRDEGRDCEWYLEQFELGHQTVGITANLSGSGGSGRTNFDHLPRYSAQMIARDQYSQARKSINPILIDLFENVVLHGKGVGRLGISFRMAVKQLSTHIQACGIVA